MEALHGRHTLPDAKNPLVVKFADAKNRDSSLDASDLIAPIKTISPWDDGTKPPSPVAPFGFNEMSAWQQSGAPYIYQNLSRGLGFNMAGVSPYLSTSFNNASGVVSSAPYMSMLAGVNSSPVVGMTRIPDISSHFAKPAAITLNGKLGPGITDPKANEWKLFVGQVPFECSERDLWPIFSQLGEVLELVILRGEGRSKGCGFVTYADRETAKLAAARLNGHVSLPNDQRGKRLVVRFADKKKEAVEWSVNKEEVTAE